MMLCALAVMPFGQAKFSLMNRPLIPWSAKTVEGRQITDRTLRGSSHVMFVFCSCIECRRVAEDWSTVRKKGVLKGKSFAPNGRTPGSVVIYVGEVRSAKKLAKDFGFPLSTVIADPKGTIAANYRAMPCPTVIVSDANGVVRYSSKEVAGDLVSDSDILLGQTLTALRHLVSRPNTNVVQESLLRSAPVSFTSVPAQGERVEAPGEVVFEGILDANAISMRRRFVFVNRSKSTIDVDALLSSCGCQRAALFFRGGEVKRASVKSGERIEIEVGVELPREESTRSVSVWLYSKGIAPVATIRMNVRRAEP